MIFNGLLILRIENARPRKQQPASLSESELEAKFFNLLRDHHIPNPTQQYIFHPQRQWRMDFSWPAHKLAVEIQGFGPGHNSYNGMSNDYEKHNEAMLLGWRILYFMAHDIAPRNQAATIAIVRKALGITTIHVPQDKSQRGRVNPFDAGRRKLDQILNKKRWS